VLVSRAIYYGSVNGGGGDSSAFDRHLLKGFSLGNDRVLIIFGPIKPFETMANHDPNHSSHERTILWIILPASVAVSLLFTNLNHKIEAPAERLSAKLDAPKKVEAPAPKPEEAHSDTTHVVGAEGAHADTTHAPAAH
jgi:hypothetical protein